MEALDLRDRQALEVDISGIAKDCIEKEPPFLVREQEHFFAAVL